MDIEDGRKVKIFCSYSHKDAKLLAEIMKQINKKHSVWYDRKIRAGQNWAEEIDSHLNSADMILLLISPDFKASDYCYSVEMTRALEREKEEKIPIIPILLRPVDWADAPYLHCHMLPEGARAVTMWRNRDAAFTSIAQGLRVIIEEELIKISSPEFVEEYVGVYFNTALNSIGRMLSLYEEAIKGASRDIIRKAHLMRSKGIRLSDFGRAKDALIVYEDILNLIITSNGFENDFCAYIYKERGDIFRYMDLFTKALEDYNMAIQLLPGFAEAIKCRDKILKDMNPEG